MSRGLRSDETLLFLHIPKAAGTTLSRIAERHVPASRHYRLGGHAQAAIQRFNDWPEAKRARYRYIAGHFPFGVHEQVPGPSAYLTFLRDPLARTASFYRFLRKQPDHPLTRAMSAAQRESLLGFLSECQEPVFDNGQTRLLAGDWGQIPFGGCDDELLRRAITNLEQIDVVGLCELFVPSLLLAARRFGWTRIGYHALNQTPASRTDWLDPETEKILRERNQLDLQLYAVAKERVERECSAQGDAFQEAVRRFAQNHPPPSAWQERRDRLRTRTPQELGKALIRKIKRQKS